MTIFYIIIAILLLVVLVLALSINTLINKGIYISEKEKEFVTFVIEIFEQYGDDLGIQSKEQHAKLVEELNKIKNAHFKLKKDNTKKSDEGLQGS